MLIAIPKIVFIFIIASEFVIDKNKHVLSHIMDWNIVIHDFCLFIGWTNRRKSNWESFAQSESISRCVKWVQSKQVLLSEVKKMAKLMLQLLVLACVAYMTIASVAIALPNPSNFIYQIHSMSLLFSFQY